MWTPTIKAVTKFNNTSVSVDVEFSNGVETREMNYQISDLKSIKRILQNQIDQWQAVDEFVATPPIGVVDLTPEVVVKPTPTQEQLDQIAYAQKRQALVVAKQDLDLGLIAQADFDALKSEVIAVKPVVEEVIK